MMIKTQQKITFLTLIPLLHFSQAYNFLCTPSACGDIPHIKYPYRLKGDPNHCGYPELELVCENVTSIYLNSHQYYVKAISYNTSTIRLVDASLNSQDNCSFPTSSAYSYNFTYGGPYLFLTKEIYTINLMRCPTPLKNSSLFTEVTTHCASLPKFTYIKVGHLNASEIPHLCTLDLIVMTSWQEFKDLNSSSYVSLSQIHQSLLYGFDLEICLWCKTSLLWAVLSTLVVILGLLCAGICACLPFTLFLFVALSILLYRTSFRPAIEDIDRYAGFNIGLVLGFYFVTKFIISPLTLWFLIYKFRRRHLSVYEEIEDFLQSNNELVPIRYSYSDIKRMTRGFREKLGEGGYGHVYKGKLRSGNDVAVKLLTKSGGNGHDFMNEIATIGRIHHVNVVKLVGYCAHGSKRALVFDFMSNGSLDKYLFNQEKMDSLNWDKKFDIAAGVARGIEYLHQGCDIQILHFDIKPHNVLLDGNFVPKISDFGLAKYFSKEKNSLTLTAARGTIGYVAPELVNRSIGLVSHKADVCSFGMMLMEIVGLKRDLQVETLIRVFHNNLVN